MKSIKVYALILVAFILGVVGVQAGVNWSTSSGGAWYTPNDTTATVGQPVLVGSGGGAVLITGAPLSVYPRTLAQLKALTPDTTGQIAFCTDCTNSFLVISSAVARGSWMSVFKSTPSTNANVLQ